MIKEINTACPRNCYSGCSFKVVLENERIVSMEPQSENRATSEGPCLKGISHIERQYADDRILYPLRKTGNDFIRISWEEAIDEITSRLKQLKNDYGSHSVYFYSASGMAGLLNSIPGNFWKEFGGVTTTYGDLCWPAGLEATRLTLGEIKHNTPWDIENAKLLVIWGKNPAESNVQQIVFIEKARRKGAKVVIIDPRRTPSTEFADLHLQPKPGTDGMLALAVAKIIIEKGNTDNRFIENYVAGYNEFCESLENIDLESASENCGIPVNFIETLAEYIGTSAPMTIIPGYGMQRYSNGGQTMRCILALQVITGNIGKPGACWHYANLQSYVFDELKEPLSLYPDINNDGINRRVIPTARIGEALLETTNPEIKFAWIERGNPVSQNPDSQSTINALRKIDTVVVVEQFLTDTAREADIVLPAKTMFEQSDILGSYWNPYVRLRQKAIEPPGEVKPESEIYYLLGKKLGWTDELLQTFMPLPGDENTDIWLEKLCEKHEHISIELLKQGPVLAPGHQEIAYSDMEFKTASGKIELYSPEAQQRWNVNPIPDYIPLKESTSEEYPFNLLSPVTKNRIHSQFGNLISISALHPEPYAEMNPHDAKASNINDGNKIRIFNRRGEMFVKVRFNPSLRPGSISVYNGYWITEGACPNILSLGRETDMGHGAAFHDNCVNVENK